MIVAVGNALQWADFRSKQSYQLYTNIFRNQENGDCLLQWPASIAEDDGRLWRHYEAYCLWWCCSTLHWSAVQRPIGRLKEQPEIRSFEILTAVSAAVMTFRNMKLCDLVNRQRYSGRTRHFTAGSRRYIKDRCRNLIVSYTNLCFIAIINNY